MNHSRQKFLALEILILALLPAYLYSIHPGDLDPSFGGNPRPGLQITDFFGGNDQANAVTVQSDGKIIAVGQTAGGPGGTNFALARYNIDGSLDDSFGGGTLGPKPGTVVTDFFGGTDIARGVVVQPDGKILAVGSAAGGPGGTNFALARYNTDGSLDETFGGNPAPGLMITDFFGGQDVIRSVVLQPDGKIVVAGEADGGPDGRTFALARYNTDGSLDVTFGGIPAPGLVVTSFFAVTIDQAFAVALQADGKIVAAGLAGIGPGNTDFGLARYNTDGSLDATFGGNPAPGLVITDFFGATDQANAVAIRPNGKIVAVGFASGGPGATNFALAQYNTDGSLDLNFGGDPAPGLVVTDFFGSTDIAFGTVLQPDGKIIAVGQVSGGPGGVNFGLARYNTNGSLDDSFGGGTLGPKPGTVVTDFFGSTDAANAVTLQEDGKIVAVGLVSGGGGSINFGLARYFAFTPGRISALTQAIIDKYC